MISYIDSHWWPLMWFFLGIAIISFWFMADASRYFYYDRWTKRSFSIIDLQFPSSARYYCYILISLNNREQAESRTALHALKRNLYWDFVFMIGIYPVTALLCLHVYKIWSNSLFLLLAWSQLIAWCLDILENILIFWTIVRPKLFIKTGTPDGGITDDDKDGTIIYKVYRLVVSLKWILGGSGLILPIIAIMYNYFYTDNYSGSAFWKGLVMFLLMLSALIVAGKIQAKKVPEHGNGD